MNPSTADPRGPAPISPATVTDQLRELGVHAGTVLLVHTSYRAIRPIEWGPRGLIMALQEAVGDRGTIVMPSWGGDDDHPFDGSTTESSEGLGVVPRIFWRQTGVRRSRHLHAFAARGPRAEEILRDPLPLPPHIPESPVGRVHDLDGQVLLLGVNHDADTTLHLAELLYGAPYRVPRSCTVLQEGRPVRIDYGENDHCCARFRLVEGWLKAEGLQSEGPVGHGHARLARSRDIVRVAGRRLSEDPLVFLHPPEAGCEECDEARASVVSTGSRTGEAPSP